MSMAGMCHCHWKRALFLLNKRTLGTVRNHVTVISAQMNRRIAIVGGGMAGISAAERLAKSLDATTESVTLFDKGRHLGGRCSSRNVVSDGEGEHLLPYGCQFVCPSSVEFQRHVDMLHQGGYLKKYQGGIAELDGSGNRAAVEDSKVGESFIGKDGRNMYVDFQLRRYSDTLQSKGVDVRPSCDVTGMEYSQQDGMWNLRIKDNLCNNLSSESYTHVILADWSAAHSLTGNQECQGFYKKLEAVEFTPVFALAVNIKGKTGLRVSQEIGFRAAIIEPSDTLRMPLSPFKFIGCMTASGDDSGEYWIALTSELKSKHLLSNKWPMYDENGRVLSQTVEYRNGVAKELERDFRVALETLLRQSEGPPLDSFSVSTCFSHRWGRAFPVQSSQIDEYCNYDTVKKLGVCGDMFRPASAYGNISPLESAWMSGINVSDAIIADKRMPLSKI
jgi:predicted NAD/FAD-dependent oxidoreductase